MLKNKNEWVEYITRVLAQARIDGDEADLLAAMAEVTARDMAMVCPGCRAMMESALREVTDWYATQLADQGASPVRCQQHVGAGDQRIH